MASPVGYSVRLLRWLARNAATLGADPDELLGSAGVAPDADADTYVPDTPVIAAFRHLAAACGDPTLGLTLARASPPGSLGIFDYMLLTSSTLRDAVQRAVRLYPLLSSRATLHFEERHGLARVSYHLRPGAKHDSFFWEFGTAAFVLRAREALRDRLPLRAVHFVRKQVHAERYESFFQAEVLFGRPVDEFVFDAPLLDRPFRTADPTTLRLLEPEAEVMQRRLAEREPFLERVRRLARESLRSKRSDLLHLAKQLRISPRTLQRQLEAQGTSHRQLLDDGRRDLARRMIAEAEGSAGEVAYELGYATEAAFYRAFRRWTGMTPSQFRERQRADPRADLTVAIGVRGQSVGTSRE